MNLNLKRNQPRKVAMQDQPKINYSVGIYILLRNSGTYFWRNSGKIK